MDDKTNLYVFEKKEVLLIFIFMLLIAVTAFVLGVKVGKTFTYSDITQVEKDFDQLQFQSDKEEEMQEQVVPTEIPADVTNKLLEDSLKEELTREEARLNEASSKPEPAATNSLLPQVQLSTTTSQATSPDLDGKYTIQLGSHRSYDEAEQFARGFTVRGYNPIIKETEIPGKGIWFRVSIGVFDSVSDARDYVLKESTLFHGEDYVFQRF